MYDYNYIYSMRSSYGKDCEKQVQAYGGILEIGGEFFNYIEEGW